MVRPVRFSLAIGVGAKLTSGFEGRQVTRRAAALWLLVVLGGACGPWQRVGSPERRPGAGTTLPRLFDASSVYRSMGFLVSPGPLPFVASVHYLAGPTADSTLVVVALSLANQALSFRRAGNEFVGAYRVEMVFRTDSGVARQAARDEQVRVRSFQETLRADESVIFQQYLVLPPGVYQVSVVVRDRNGPAFGRAENTDTAPAFTGRTLALPVAYYEGDGRSQTGVPPQLVLNPRATLPYGADTLRFYVEGYGLPAGARVVARVVDAADRELWRDTVSTQGGAQVAAASVTVVPGRLPVGQAELTVAPVRGAGPGDTVRARFLVSFSSQWVITNFEEMVSLLRHFDRQDWVDSLRRADAEARPATWEGFWKATDPVPITPENEALDAYFRRIQQANVRFQDEGEPGWLTDRGEVFITIGEPDEVLDMSRGMDRTGTRAIRWTYTTHRLVLYFQDQSGFGQYRLTPASRAEYQRIRSRIRRSQ